MRILALLPDAFGDTRSLEEFVDRTFSELGLDWRAHVESDPALLRPSDIHYSGGDAAKARDRLGWEAALHMPDVVARMVAAEGEGADAHV